MKAIAKEYKIVKSNCSNILHLYRFPVNIKALNLVELKLKPRSNLADVIVSLPVKNTSALKVKALNTENLAYRAFPSTTKTLYFTVIEDETIHLFPFQLTYVFQPHHFYYPFDYVQAKLKKAESRDEYEHRLRSINYKLKSVELEAFKTFQFEETKFIPKIETQTGYFKNHLKSQTGSVVNQRKLETVVKRTRIVNMQTLNELYGNENLIKSTLFKLTDQVCGRFVLKNIFYEKTLHLMRKQLLQLFCEKSTVQIKDVSFLGEERWMVEELADLRDGFYYLKGFKEIIEFDNESIKAANLSNIKDLMKRGQLLTAKQIGMELSIDEDLVIDLLSADTMIFHLSNNSYVLCDNTSILHPMFDILTNRRSFELSELVQALEKKEVEFVESQLIEEIRKYCTHRAGKFYLKVVKEQPN
ncbi:hypothetical protein GINT2_000738 [Glugoides intestinalis]